MNITVNFDKFRYCCQLYYFLLYHLHAALIILSIHVCISFFVAVPANEFELYYTELSDSSVNVTCEAQGLFPNPILKLNLASSNGSPPQPVINVKSHSKQKPSGAYDALLRRTFSANELTKNGASVFECSLELPGTNYARSKRIAYYPGKYYGICMLLINVS